MACIRHCVYDECYGRDLFEIRSCIEILANDIKVDTSTVNR